MLSTLTTRFGMIVFTCLIAIGLAAMVAYNLAESADRAALAKLRQSNKICYPFPGEGTQSEVLDRAASLRINQIEFEMNGSIPGYDVSLALTQMEEGQDPTQISIVLFDQKGNQTAFETIASFTQDELAKSETRVIRAELPVSLDHRPFAYALKVR